MPSDTPVDRLYSESLSVIAAIGMTEPSIINSASDNFRKSLLLAAASYFEHRVSQCVMDFIDERSSGATLVISFVKNKAIARQYHTWFKWDDLNANHFFGLFGADFKKNMQNRVKESEELRGSIQAFLEVGNERNKLVHQDFASFPMEKTLQEIYEMYQKALRFVDALASYLRAF